MKYLVVEDELISRRVLGDLLLPFGECDYAVNGQEAIDLFRTAHELNRPYDVIFMDIMMPVVDGLEALLKIRSIEKSMKIPPSLAVTVLVTTALEDPDTIIKAFVEGNADSFLVKPIHRERLLREMAALKLIVSPMASEKNLICLDRSRHRNRESEALSLVRAAVCAE
ncbi:MAG: response regulator [Desulfuromonadaceae bacterium]|nr:response regulator [Desulfuromonadaceae bacterium]